MTVFVLPPTGTSQAVFPRRQAAPAFSGNAVNVYTGTARAQALEPRWKLQPWFGG